VQADHIDRVKKVLSKVTQAHSPFKIMPGAADYAKKRRSIIGRIKAGWSVIVQQLRQGALRSRIQFSHLIKKKRPDATRTCRHSVRMMAISVRTINFLAPGHQAGALAPSSSSCGAYLVKRSGFSREPVVNEPGQNLFSTTSFSSDKDWNFGTSDLLEFVPQFIHGT